jgi:hypothetical protein
MGRVIPWEVGNIKSNPVISAEVQEYMKAIQLEQAQGHVVPVQAPPLFLDKLRRISKYLVLQIGRPDLSATNKLVLFRDRAFLLLQFFAGDRAGDLGSMLTQEIKRLEDNSGFLISHTFGKV